jgi:hypothetical protein
MSKQNLNIFYAYFTIKGTPNLLITSSCITPTIRLTILGPRNTKSKVLGTYIYASTLQLVLRVF